MMVAVATVVFGVALLNRRSDAVEYGDSCSACWRCSESNPRFSPRLRSWRSAPVRSAAPCLPPGVVRRLAEATGREIDCLGRDWEEDVYVQDADTFVMPRAVCAHAAAGGRGQDLLLDFARLAGRPCLDLFPRRSEHVGQGHGPDRQDLVPQRRRRFPAGGDPRRHRRQGRRDRHHQPRSRQPRQCRQGRARGRHSGHQLQHARPEGELQRLCRRRSRGRRQGLGAATSSTTTW